MEKINWKEVGEIAAIVVAVITVLILNVEYIKSIRDIDYIMFALVGGGCLWVGSFATRWYYKHVLKIDTTKKDE